MPVDVEKLKAMVPPAGLPFGFRRLGHVVLNVQDLERSTRFYTQVLGFRVSDVYDESMTAGGMVFLRCGTDHHSLALVGSGRAPSNRVDLNHVAFEAATLDELFRFRDHLRKHGVKIIVHGRRRAGCQVAVEFFDPDNHHVELYWGLDQVGTDGHVRPREEWREFHSLEEAVDHPPPGQDTTLQDPALRKPRG